MDPLPDPVETHAVRMRISPWSKGLSGGPSWETLSEGSSGKAPWRPPVWEGSSGRAFLGGPPEGDFWTPCFRGGQKALSPHVNLGPPVTSRAQKGVPSQRVKMALLGPWLIRGTPGTLVPPRELRAGRAQKVGFWGPRAGQGAQNGSLLGSKMGPFFDPLAGDPLLGP